MRKRTEYTEKKKYSQTVVDTEEMKRQILREINTQKVDIDRSVFTKTDEEKALLALAKAEYNHFIKKSN